jgi:hypothetical protein
VRLRLGQRRISSAPSRLCRRRYGIARHPGSQADWAQACCADSHRPTDNRYSLHRLHRQQLAAVLRFQSTRHCLGSSICPEAELDRADGGDGIVGNLSADARGAVSNAELSLIVRAPPRPSRRKVISMPRIRRKVWARRRRPARARGLLGQSVCPLLSPSPGGLAPARSRSEALPIHVLRSAIISRTRAATGSASIKSSTAALRFAW